MPGASLAEIADESDVARPEREDDVDHPFVEGMREGVVAETARQSEQSDAEQIDEADQPADDRRGRIPRAVEHEEKPAERNQDAGPDDVAHAKHIAERFALVGL